MIVRVVKPAFPESRKKNKWFVRDKFMKLAYRGPIPDKIANEVDASGKQFLYYSAKVDPSGKITFIRKLEDQRW